MSGLKDNKKSQNRVVQGRMLKLMGSFAKAALKINL